MEKGCITYMDKSIGSANMKNSLIEDSKKERTLEAYIYFFMPNLNKEIYNYIKIHIAKGGMKFNL